MKKQPAKKRTAQVQDTDNRLYVVYVSDNFYDDIKAGQVYGLHEYFLDEDDAKAYAKSILEEDTDITGGYEVYDTVVIDYPAGILKSAVSDMVMRIWYGDTRFLPMTGDDLGAFRHGMTLDEFIKGVGGWFKIYFVKENREMIGYAVAGNPDDAMIKLAKAEGIDVDEDILDCVPIRRVGRGN